jgi:hypothetical protein
MRMAPGRKEVNRVPSLIPACFLAAAANYPLPAGTIPATAPSTTGRHKSVITPDPHGRNPLMCGELMVIVDGSKVNNFSDYFRESHHNG